MPTLSAILNFGQFRSESPHFVEIILVFSKKGKRKIVGNGETFYWCVTVEKDTGIEPITLNVFSDQKYLFGVDFLYGKEIRTPVTYVNKGELCQSFHIAYEDHPEITSALVQTLILEYKRLAH